MSDFPRGVTLYASAPGVVQPGNVNIGGTLRAYQLEVVTSGANGYISIESASNSFFAGKCTGDAGWRFTFGSSGGVAYLDNAYAANYTALRWGGVDVQRIYDTKVQFYQPLVFGASGDLSVSRVSAGVLQIGDGGTNANGGLTLARLGIGVTPQAGNLLYVGSSSLTGQNAAFFENNDASYSAQRVHNNNASGWGVYDSSAKSFLANKVAFGTSGETVTLTSSSTYTAGSQDNFAFTGPKNGGGTVTFWLDSSGQIKTNYTSLRLGGSGGVQLALLTGILGIANTTAINWSADANPAGGSGFDLGLVRIASGVLKISDGGAGSGRLQVADGAAATPAYTFVAASNTGFYSYGSNYIGVANNGTAYYAIGPDDFAMRSTVGISWSSGVLGAAADTGLVRATTNIVKFTDGSTGYGGLRAANAALIMGNSGTLANVPAVANVNTTAVGTGNDTNETNLMTYTLPGNSLNANNRGVRITAWGSTLAAANNQVIRLYFGTEVIATVGANAFGSNKWRLVAEVVRTSSGNQNSNTFYSLGGGSYNGCVGATTTQTDTASITVKATGTNGAATVNGVKQDFMMVEFIN